MRDTSRRRILELAMTAPNVDNAQPFFFQWQGEQLLILRDENRDRRRGNAGYTVSMVGLGCLLECLAIAATGEGLGAQISITYNTQSLTEPWAVVSFAPGAPEADELLPGLELRCSDRRRYLGGDLSDDVFGQVLADSRRYKGCHLYLQDRPDARLLDYLLRCEAFVWNDRHMLPEMLSWVRWSKQEVQRTRDGVPWQAMGIPFLVSRLMMLVAKSRLFRRFARRSGAPLRSQQENVEAQAKSSAALGCFTVDAAQPSSMLPLGRAFLRAWVRLNMDGYGLQVMANPSLHVLQHTAGILPDDYPQASRRVFAEGRVVLTEAFGCNTAEIPAWMFRTGKSPSLPEEMRTLRRPLSEVVRTGRS